MACDLHPRRQTPDPTPFNPWSTPVTFPTLRPLVLSFGIALVAAPALAADGKAVYDGTCSVCHAAGVANAPKLGDKAAWAPRIKTGAEALYASVLKGKGAMPPKGGNAALADADVKAAVDYIVAGSK